MEWGDAAAQGRAEVGREAASAPAGLYIYRYIYIYIYIYIVYIYIYVYTCKSLQTAEAPPSPSVDRRAWSGVRADAASCFVPGCSSQTGHSGLCLILNVASLFTGRHETAASCFVPGRSPQTIQLRKGLRQRNQQQNLIIRGVQKESQV